MAAHLPGRTDNEIKNFWNTSLRKKLLQMGIDPNTHKPRADLNHLMNLSQLLSSSQLSNLIMNNCTTINTPWENSLKLQADVAHQYIAKIQLFQNLMQVMNSSSSGTISNTSTPNIENINPSTLLGTPQNNLNLFEGPIDYGQIQNLGIVPCGQNDSQAIDPNPWPSDEGVGCAGGRDGYDLQKNSADHQEGIHDENIDYLPRLVSAPFPGTSFSDQVENKSDHNSVTTTFDHSPSSPTFFEAWEKLMDDETSESYWKDILEYALYTILSLN